MFGQLVELDHKTNSCVFWLRSQVRSVGWSRLTYSPKICFLYCRKADKRTKTPFLGHASCHTEPALHPRSVDFAQRLRRLVDDDATFLNINNSNLCNPVWVGLPSALLDVLPVDGKAPLSYFWANTKKEMFPLVTYLPISWVVSLFSVTYCLKMGGETCRSTGGYFSNQVDWHSKNFLLIPLIAGVCQSVARISR